MYAIQKSGFGYSITFSGNVTADEMRHWLKESASVLSETSRGFGTIVDIRDMSPPSSEVRTLWGEGRRIYKERGLGRSAVIVSNAHLGNEYREIAEVCDIADSEKYIDASGRPNWRDVAMNWVVRGVDPDSSTQSTQGGTETTR